MSDYTAEYAEAACCIWEYMLETPSSISDKFGGATYARMFAVELAPYCHQSWEWAFKTAEYDDCFDWEWVPDYMEALYARYTDPDEMLDAARHIERRAVQALTHYALRKAV